MTPAEDEAMPTPAHPLTTAQRADLVTARETITRAVAGQDVDLEVAAAILDRLLAETCPHDPATWHTAPDAEGRALTTCGAREVSWFAHADRGPVR